MNVILKKSKNAEDKNIHTLYGLGFTQYQKGETINGKKKLMLLSFDNYDLLKNNKIKYNGMLCNIITHEPFYKNLEVIHINLALVRNILYNTIDIAKLDEMIKYLIMIVNPSKRIGKILEREIHMKKANKRLNNYIKDFRYVSRVIDKAYKKIERQEGIEEGLKKGRKQSIKIGEEKGIKQLVKNMIKNNLDDNTINQYTDIPINKIQKLRKSIA